MLFKRSTLMMAITAASFSSISLAQTDKQLEKVVVTAAGFEQTITDAPASISVIDREELEKKAYSNVMDAVKNIPGLYVTGGGNSQDISIRGMSKDYTLYMIDGRPLSSARSVNTNGADSGKQIGLPPISMIERIEVIRGPMSSLYGADAMGGVINIITRKPTKAWKGTIAAEYNHSLSDIQNDNKSVNLFTSGAIVEGLLSAQVNASFQGHDEADFIGASDSGESTPESKRNKSGVKFVLTPTKSDEFGFSYDASRLSYTKTPGKSIAATASPSAYEFDKDIYVLDHKGKYNNWTVTTYLQHDVSEKVQTLTKKEVVTTLDSNAVTTFGNHVLSFGGRYKEEEVTNESTTLFQSGAPGAVAVVDRWIGEAFTEIDWGVTDDLRVTTGVRVNHDELFGTHVTPRIYGVFTATDEWTIKGGISTGYKQPTLAQSTPGFGSGTGGGQVTRDDGLTISRAMQIGNLDVEAEKSTSYEVGTVFTSANHDLTSSIMAFYTQFDDKITELRICDSTDPTQRDEIDPSLPAYNANIPSTWICDYAGVPYSFISTPTNVDEAVLHGVEWTLGWGILNNLRLNSSMTYTDSEQKSGPQAGRPLNKTPRTMANISLEYQATPTLSLWSQANYRSATTDALGRNYSITPGTPAYHFVDIGLNYKLNSNATVKAGIYNLADREVTAETYSVVLDGRRFNLGLTVDF
jgi:outer membrane receptor for ferrienterochelin and colicins